jgi:phosphohistidine phosphatase SixA
LARISSALWLSTYAQPRSISALGALGTSSRSSRRVVQVVSPAPVEAEPAHRVDDGVDVLLLFLLRIGVVEAQVAAAAVVARQAEVQADRLGVAECAGSRWARAGSACGCRTYRIGDRSGQRNLSAAGREQSQRIGAAFRQHGIPLALPVLSSPVFRARDTAELAFGAAQVEVTDSLLADDYAGNRLGWVIAEHRRLVATEPPPNRNVVLIGHRGPIVMALGAYVGGDSLPEGAALVIDPSGGTARVLGVIVLAPLAEPGRETC